MPQVMWPLKLVISTEVSPAFKVVRISASSLAEPAACLTGGRDLPVLLVLPVPSKC